MRATFYARVSTEEQVGMERISVKVLPGHAKLNELLAKVYAQNEEKVY